jgi:hypothetical protein
MPQPLVNNIALGGDTLGLGYHIPRLMLQPLIIWWALWAGSVIDWPFKKRDMANQESV